MPETYDIGDRHSDDGCAVGIAYSGAGAAMMPGDQGAPPAGWLARADSVIAVPNRLRLASLPGRRLIGDRTDERRLLAGLDRPAVA
jgi:hypothetical protein